MTLTSPNSQGIVLSDSGNPFKPAYDEALAAFRFRPPSAKDLINLTEYLRENLPAPAKPTAAEVALTNETVISLVLDSRKIAAIKELRTLTGASLKDAKEAVETPEFLAVVEARRPVVAVVEVPVGPEVLEGEAAYNDAPEGTVVKDGYQVFTALGNGRWQEAPDGTIWERGDLSAPREIVSKPAPVEPPKPTHPTDLRGKGAYREAPNGTIAEELEKRDGVWVHASTGFAFNDGTSGETNLPFARREVTVWGSEPEAKQPHKIGAGDRVIFARDSTGQVGRVFAKGTTGVVHNTFTADLAGPNWVGKHEAVNVTLADERWPTTVKVADLIVYKAVTEMPQDGDELVILAEPWLGDIGDIVKVTTRRPWQSAYTVNTEDHGSSLVMGRDNRTYPSADLPSRRYGLVVR